MTSTDEKIVHIFLGLPTLPASKSMYGLMNGTKPQYDVIQERGEEMSKPDDGKVTESKRSGRATEDGGMRDGGMRDGGVG